MRYLFVGFFAAAVGCAFPLPFPGTVFAQAKEKVLHSFGSGTDGGYPFGGLVNLNGTLYGTTQVGGDHDQGAVFALDRKTGAETIVYSFAGGADGADPEASLIAVNGMLYGTTNYGG